MNDLVTFIDHRFPVGSQAHIVEYWLSRGIDPYGNDIAQ